MFLRALLSAAGLLAGLQQVTHAQSDLLYSTDPASFDAQDIIRRDVAVIGGGSSGTYTAVRLGDFNKSVVVIEPKSHLGGHAESYTDPLNGYTTNIGVTVFANISTVKNYFARFGVPLQPISDYGNTVTKYVKLATGELQNFTPPTAKQQSQALAAYSTQLQKFPALQNSFNMSYPVDPELLMPFGEFAAKYNLSGMMPNVFVNNQGFVPLLNLSTLYMLKYLNQDEVNSLNNGFLTTVAHNTQALYQKIIPYLGPNALLNSSVLAMDRSGSEVRVLVKTPAGRKLVVAKKLVSTAPPLVSNLRNYDLSAAEKTLFGQFRANGYYTGILNNTGLPNNEALQNVDVSMPFSVPQLPGIYTAAYNAAIGMYQAYFASPNVMTDADAQKEMVAEINRYKKVNGLSTATDPNFVIFSSHAPFNLMVSNDAIKNGFYKKLFALQGQRNTFYNGAAWATQDSSALWKFTDQYVLPILLASL